MDDTNKSERKLEFRGFIGSRGQRSCCWMPCWRAPFYSLSLSLIFLSFLLLSLEPHPSLPPLPLHSPTPLFLFISTNTAQARLDNTQCKHTHTYTNRHTHAFPRICYTHSASKHLLAMVVCHFYSRRVSVHLDSSESVCERRERLPG